MNNNGNLIHEVQQTMEADMMDRKDILEARQAQDEVIQKQMANGEIGISHGSDHVVSFLMFIIATLVTLLALYIVFEINPDHYQF